MFDGRVVLKQQTQNHEINLVRECGVKTNYSARKTTSTQ